jgi:anti-sigma regulatory factor (Ser/Thr protein kinase)
LEIGYSVAVEDSTHAAEARRAATALASGLSFDESEIGNVALVVTEAARNLLKHAGGGDLILRALETKGTAGVEMIAIDKGPGIENVGRCFQDGYSTAGTPGTGLGAIARLSTIHDIYSLPGRGTVLLAQVWRRERTGRNSAGGALLAGAISVPKRGEPVCGDEWGLTERAGGSRRLIVADGLGHGLLAADAARTAVRIAGEQSGTTGPHLMERIHEALRPTRGAAVAVAEIDQRTGVVRYTGIGNISGRVVSPSGAVQHMVSHPGTAGHMVHKIAEFQYPWHPGSTMVLHSDGLSGSWTLAKYQGLAARHPSVIAAVLYRDHRRERDDATVVALRMNGDTGAC